MGVELIYCDQCNELWDSKPYHQRHLKSKKHIANLPSRIHRDMVVTPIPEENKIALVATSGSNYNFAKTEVIDC